MRCTLRKSAMHFVQRKCLSSNCRSCRQTQASSEAAARATQSANCHSAWGGGVQTTHAAVNFQKSLQIKSKESTHPEHLLIRSNIHSSSIEHTMARQHILTAFLCAADLSCKVLSFSPTSSTWLSHRLASLAGVTKQDERESRHKRKSIATYQDEAYEMFLSNIEKDMIESWKDEMERSMADEVPSFGLDTAFGGRSNEIMMMTTTTTTTTKRKA